MLNPEIQYFDVSEIFCEEWGRGVGIADVWASNYVGDSLSFSIAWHPDDYIFFYDLKLDFYSLELLPFMAEDAVTSGLLATAEEKLDRWWKEVVELREALNPKIWDPIPGSPIEDGYYALLAILYETRKIYSSDYIVECMALDIGASVAATKQRVRKAREKEFLTSPGKGLVGKGKVTQKALNLVRKEKLL